MQHKQLFVKEKKKKKKMCVQTAQQDTKYTCDGVV